MRVVWTGALNTTGLYSSVFTERYGLVCTTVCLLRGTDWFYSSVFTARCGLICTAVFTARYGLVCTAVCLLRGTNWFVQQCVYCELRTGLYISAFTARYGLVLYI